MVDEDEKKLSDEDIEYLKKMEEAIKGKDTQEQPTKEKESLRKKIQQRAQQYVKEKQEKEYQKQVVKVFVQDQTGNWKLYKTVNKQNKEQINNIRKELINKQVIFQEVEGSPEKGLSQLNTYAGKLTKKWQQNLQETTKDIKKEVPRFMKEVNQTFAPNTTRTPTMGIPAWGSMAQPSGPKSEQLPVIASAQSSFRDYVRRSNERFKKPQKRQYLPNEEYQGLLQQGHTVEELDEYGIKNIRSPYWQDYSKFGKLVSPYKPVSYGQCFLQFNPQKTEFQKRLERGESYRGAVIPIFSPPAVTSSQMLFKPPMLPRPLFRPKFAGRKPEVQ